MNLQNVLSFINHSRYCRGVIRIEKAYVIGRLYDMGVGYPALELPPRNVIVNGTLDYHKDIHTQTKEKLNHQRWNKLGPLAGGWGLVHGEILTFRYHEKQLATLDKFEQYNPSKRSIYQRVLSIAQCNGQTEPVWMYIMTGLRGQKVISNGIWR